MRADNNNNNNNNNCDRPCGMYGCNLVLTKVDQNHSTIVFAALFVYSESHQVLDNPTYRERKSKMIVVLRCDSVMQKAEEYSKIPSQRLHPSVDDLLEHVHVHSNCGCAALT